MITDFANTCALIAPFGADRQHVLAQLDLALDLPLDGQVFAAVELAFDDDRFAYVHSSFSPVHAEGRRPVAGRRRRLRGWRRSYRAAPALARAGRCSRLCRIIPFPHWAFSTYPKCWSQFRGSGSRVTSQYTHALCPLSSPFIAES